MMRTALTIVFAFFFYQSVLVAAFFLSARLVSAGIRWELVYWLVCVIGINIFTLIVHNV